MNENKKYFPILGVCLGYEFLITVANNHSNFLVNCSIEFENLPLSFTHPYSQTTFFADMSKQSYEILSSTNVTANHHM